MKKLLLFLLFPLFGISQVLIGEDIDGENSQAQSGHSVSLNNDGTVVAIGAIGAIANNGTNSKPGNVRIFNNQSGVWIQIGEDIYGEADNDWSGHSVSLSSDGSVVAIGAWQNGGNGNGSGHARVYKNVSNVWTQIGEDIDGEAANDRSGYSVSLNSDGTVVAIGAPLNDANGVNSGHVRVYMNVSNVWTQIGEDIDGVSTGDWSGHSVSLSSDGAVVAIGAPTNGVDSDNFGHVRVYKNVSGVWTQIGEDINGEAIDDYSGKSVSLSSNGSVVAIGAPSNDGNGGGSGHVRVYKNLSGVWTQIGEDIDGEAANDSSGNSISLSADGTVVAIGAYTNDGNGSDSGHVRVYKNVSEVWIQIGEDIDGEATYDTSGYSVSLSSDGTVVAIGANSNRGNGLYYSGHVRVYDLTAVLSTESFKHNYFSFYPNPVNDVLNIELDNGLELKQVNIYNIQSQYLYSAKTKTINTENLKSGVYFVEVETNKGKSAKKIVVE